MSVYRDKPESQDVKLVDVQKVNVEVTLSPIEGDKNVSMKFTFSGRLRVVGIFDIKQGKEIDRTIVDSGFESFSNWAEKAYKVGYLQIKNVAGEEHLIPYHRILDMHYEVEANNVSYEHPIFTPST